MKLEEIVCKKAWLLFFFLIMVIIFQFKHEMHSIVWVAALYYAPCFVLGFLIRCFQDLPYHRY
jgi:hypothetical protein